MTGPIQLLIAEDNEADVVMMRESLNAAGLLYQWRVASNGEKALALLDEIAESGGTLDGIILDLNLTTHSGIEVLERVRTIRALDGACVMILTSSDSPNDRHQADLLGADAYFRKPMDLDQFLELGREIVDCIAQRRAKRETA